MPPKKVPDHCGSPTEGSLAAFALDQTQLLECKECGAWVSAAPSSNGEIVLDKHLDRRPKLPNRNRGFVIRSGRGF